jgi:hypothetical protein
MSYDPSYRMPPRQERWPNATPAEGWPSYRDGDDADRHGAGRGARPAAVGRPQAGRHAADTAHAAVATAPFPPAGNGHTGRRAGGYPSGGYAPEFDWAERGYAGTGYAGTPDDFAGNYLGPGSYIEPGVADPPLRGDPRLTAPDAGVRPDTWLADLEYRREASWRGPMVSAVNEVLATGVVIGVSTLAAGLLKARTSPAGAMGAAFVDRTPAALRTAALHHFGTQGRAVLLLGMYAAFAVTAIAIGVLARRSVAVGVAGIAMFALFAAFAVITRPGGHVGDITPAVLGGIAGIAAVLWLFRASAPAQRSPAPLRRTRGGTRRRTR